MKQEGSCKIYMKQEGSCKVYMKQEGSCKVYMKQEGSCDNVVASCDTGFIGSFTAYMNTLYPPFYTPADLIFDIQQLW